MVEGSFDLYEFPAGWVGKKTYVSVRGHTRSIPKPYTYRGSDGRNYVLPDYGGDWSGYSAGAQTASVMSDIGEYTSPIDGKVISSRSTHREHMRQHGVIEVGNERMPARREQSLRDMGVGRDIKRTLEQLRSR